MGLKTLICVLWAVCVGQTAGSQHGPNIIIMLMDDVSAPEVFFFKGLTDKLTSERH